MPPRKTAQAAEIINQNQILMAIHHRLERMEKAIVDIREHIKTTDADREHARNQIDTVVERVEAVQQEVQDYFDHVDSNACDVLNRIQHEFHAEPYFMQRKRERENAA